MPYIIHILTFLGALWFFSIVFGVLKTVGSNYFTNLLVKWKLFFRLLAVFGVLKIGYELYDLSSDKSWSKNEKKLFTQELVAAFSKKIPANRQDIKDFCDCLVDKVSQTTPYDDFIKNSSIVGSDARKIYESQIDSCYQKYSYKLNNKSDRQH